jgi:FKBP-type peptidyl-prolyl cis-trans isomerase
MRTAYGGRAAAYEKMGDYEKALADHNMVVTYYAIEYEILTSLGTPDGKLMTDAAGAYLERSKCQDVLGRKHAAQVDRKRAADLQSDAKKLAGKSAKTAKTLADHFTIENAWTGTVTITVNGIDYRLEAGEEKAIPTSTATVVGRLQTGAYLQSMTLEAGKAYRIR